jgi:hypothetical protein
MVRERVTKQARRIRSSTYSFGKTLYDVMHSCAVVNTIDGSQG